MCLRGIRANELKTLIPLGCWLISNFDLNMTTNPRDGRERKDISTGCYVEVVQKHHQRSGELTEGVVKRILTKSSNHPHGIKVLLDTGEVGRVKNVLPD